MKWERLSEYRFEAMDGRLRYVVRYRKHEQRWRITFGGVAIGLREGFGTIGAALEYVEHGGEPPRMD